MIRNDKSAIIIDVRTPEEFNNGHLRNSLNVNWFDENFDENLKIIVTSNTKISELYKDGLQRDQFKPFIKIMQKNSIEHELIISDDYRKTSENKQQRYFFPLNQETNFRINKFSRIITKNK